MSTHYIASEADWISVSGSVSNGDTITLTSDITFTNSSVNVLTLNNGTTFNGQSYTIVTASGRITGLFQLYGGTIQNLTIDGNANTMSSLHSLFLTGDSNQYGTISNCKAINATNGQNGGGFVGYNFGNTSQPESVIEYCETRVTLVTRSGGITGSFLKNTLIKDCIVRCPDITYGPFIGGVCPFNSGDVSVTGCYIATSVRGGGTEGGIFGTTIGGTINISKCIIAGNIGNGAGGFFGRTESGNNSTITISDSYVSGDITGTNAYGAATITNSLGSGSTMTIERVYQSGSITGSFHAGIAVNNGGTLIVDSVYLGTTKLKHYGTTPSSSNVHLASDILSIVPGDWDNSVWDAGSTYPLLNSFKNNTVWDGYTDYNSEIGLQPDPTTPAPAPTPTPESTPTSQNRLRINGVQIGNPRQFQNTKQSGMKTRVLQQPIRWDRNNLSVRVRFSN